MLNSQILKLAKKTTRLGKAKQVQRDKQNRNKIKQLVFFEKQMGKVLTPLHLFFKQCDEGITVSDGWILEKNKSGTQWKLNIEEPFEYPHQFLIKYDPADEQRNEDETGYTEFQTKSNTGEFFLWVCRWKNDSLFPSRVHCLGVVCFEGGKATEIHQMPFDILNLGLQYALEEIRRTEQV